QRGGGRPGAVSEAVRSGRVAAGKASARHQVLDELAAAIDDRADADADAPLHRGHAGLQHVFTVLGLALPAEPLRIALHAVQTDDPELRGTALEYLESILPPDVRAQLWPLLDGEAAQAAEALGSPPPRVRSIEPLAARSRDEILEALHLAYPRVVDKLRQRMKPA